jgi:hypothetical protein
MNIGGTAGAAGGYLSSDAGPMWFLTSGVERMRIDAAGNVGIGGTPTNPLTIISDTSAQVRISTVSSNVNARLSLGASGTGVNVIGSTAAIPLTFAISSTEVARFDASGNIGVGVSATSVGYGKEIAISGDTASGIGAFGVRNLAAANNIVYMTNNAKNTGAFTDSYWTSASASKYQQSSAGHQWLFAASGTAGNAITFVEQMRIDSSGRIQMGGATDGLADVNIRTQGSATGSGSLSLAASSAGGGGASYLIMGNSDSGGTTGPNVIVSANRILQIGVGSSFASRTGGTFTEYMRIDATGNIAIGTTATSGIKLNVDAGSLGPVANWNSTNANGIYHRFSVSGTAIGDLGSAFQLFGSGSATDFGLNARAGFALVFGTNQVQRMSISATGDVTVAGAFYAATKSFLIPHPSKPGMKLRYGSLESPYHGVRLTGQASVINGYCRVTLPDYIRDLVKDDGSQVQLTNIQHGKVLWVQEINIAEGTFDVMCETTDRELKFFWSFTAVRKDVPNMIVEE